MERYNTLDVPPERRVSYWTEAVARTSSPATFTTPDPEACRCALKHRVFDRFSVSHSVASNMAAHRSKAALRDAPDAMHLFLQLEGKAELSTSAKRCELTPGSLVLFDASSPYRYHTNAESSALTIGFPASFVESRLPEFRSVAMQVIDGNEGLSMVLQSTLRAIANMFDEQDGRRLTRPVFQSVLELFSALIEDPGACETSGNAMARWAGKIRAHVESHLDDPDLTPAAIAREFGISARYLRLIFAETGSEGSQGETLRRYILRRRLEECAALLAEPSNRYGSITRLAHSWGFSDSSYFARRFIEQFGATPRAYRSSMQNRH